MIFKKEMSNTHTPKTLFAFYKKDEATVLKKVKVASSFENNGVVYATLKCPKDKADLSSIEHLLVGSISGV